MLPGAWGGWALMLLIGVSYLALPMFQLTPPYPGWLTRLLPYRHAAAAVLVVAATRRLGWRAASVAVRRGAGRPADGRCVCLGDFQIASATAAASGRCHLPVLARRHVVALALAVSWVVLEMLPSIGEHPRAGARCLEKALRGIFYPPDMDRPGYPL